MSDEPSEGTPIGHLLKLHREQLGLTQHALATRLVSSSSSYIGLIENGLQHIGRRSMALRLAVALELDPYATDHFLQVAGFAPRRDGGGRARPPPSRRAGQRLHPPDPALLRRLATHPDPWSLNP